MTRMTASSGTASTTHSMRRHGQHTARMQGKYEGFGNAIGMTDHDIGCEMAYIRQTRECDLASLGC